MPATIVETIAEGLDECVGGAGWGANHDAARKLANASPALFAACKAVIASNMRNEAYDLCVAAVASVEGDKPWSPFTDEEFEALESAVDAAGEDAAHYDKHGTCDDGEDEDDSDEDQPDRIEIAMGAIEKLRPLHAKA